MSRNNSTSANTTKTPINENVEDQKKTLPDKGTSREHVRDDRKCPTVIDEVDHCEIGRFVLRNN